MYQKQSRGWTKHLDFILLDLVCLYIAFIISYYLRHDSFILLQSELYQSMFFVFFLIQFFISLFCESFKNVLRRGFYKEFMATGRHVVLVILCATFYLFVIKESSEYSRITMVSTGVFYLGISYIARILWKRYLLKGRPFEDVVSSMLILTSKDMLNSAISNVKENTYKRYKVAGIALIDEDCVGTQVEGTAIVANKDTLLEYICREWVDEVFVNLPQDMPIPEDLINTITGMGITTHVKLIDTVELKGQKQTVERLGNYTVLTNSINMASYGQVVSKRIIDICGGIVGCLMTIVFAIIIGPIIYIQSPGPIFFSQERIGKNGRKFRIYKFRSMYMDAEKRKKELMEQNRIKNGMMFKMDNDPRIIGGANGIGTFIRKYSIDEFPQFWNVLKGEMSLVGTRPPTVDEWEKYDLHHRARLAIKPGITGMWQISGRSDIIDFEQVVELDKKYIIEWSMGMDFKILLKTVFVVFGKKGSM